MSRYRYEVDLSICNSFDSTIVTSAAERQRDRERGWFDFSSRRTRGRRLLVHQIENRFTKRPFFCFFHEPGPNRLSAHRINTPFEKNCSATVQIRRGRRKKSQKNRLVNSPSNESASRINYSIQCRDDILFLIHLTTLTKYNGVTLCVSNENGKMTKKSVQY